MAGNSNPKFLTPSHFAKPDENIEAKTTTDNTKPVLLPPSTYENVETGDIPKRNEKATQKYGGKSMSNSDKSKILKQVEYEDFSEEKASLQKTLNKEEFLHNELQRAKRKISDLEQENEILQYDLQDREALSEVVCQLKKDLRKSKEKFNVSDKTQEYIDTIRCLRTNLQEADSKYAGLKQSYSKLAEDVRLLDDTNVYWKRKLEAKGLEFECTVCVKEQEIKEAVANLKEVSLEKDLKSNMLTQLEEKYKKLEESKKQVEDEHETLVKDKMKIEEEYNRIKVDKDRIEGDFGRIEEDKRKSLEDFERTKEVMKRMEEDMNRMREDRSRIEEDRKSIEDGKSRIVKDKERSEEELKKIERRLLDEREKCVALQSKIELKDSMITELQASVRTRQDELCQAEFECKTRVEDLEKGFEMKISQLEDEVLSRDQVLHKETQIYQESVMKKDEEIKDLSRSVEQLRSYIGEVRPSQEVEKLTETNTQLTEEKQLLTEENNTLHSTAKLLNVRLSAILEIVSIQEAELTRHGDVAGYSEDNQGLLRRWRETVFVLMVQLQSQKILESETTRKENAKLSSLNAKLQELERSNSILSHKLADQEAVTELEVNERKKLAQEVLKLREENNVLKKNESQWLIQFQVLDRSAKTVEKALLQSLANLNKTVSKLTSFDERIKFAGSRIQFISEYLVHRDSQQKTKSCDEVYRDIEINSASSRENEDHLKSEVEKLLKERAVLLNETKKHNEILQEKTTSLQEQYETIIKEKNNQIEKLEVSESDNRERLHSLQDEVETKCQEMEEASETIEELKLSLSKEKTTLEKEHREAMERERLKTAEDMSTIENQINSIRREHAKAVAALNNAERQVSREKQQAANTVANIERECGEKLARCEKQMKNFEKERNLLMVRIREDRSSVVRSQPAPGRDNTNFPKKDRHVNKEVETTSAGTGETQENIVDNEGPESINSIDAEQALAALKEIKVLSQQIVKLHDKSSDDSGSDSELVIQPSEADMS